MKVCATCALAKFENEFDKRGKKNYLQSDCKLCSTLKHSARYAAAKELVFLALGNRCCRCGFNDKRALQIDHINGNGSKHRIANIASLKYAASHPEEFQILCANCNWIKRAEKKEGTKWNFLELPAKSQMVSLRIASLFAVKNITGFIPEDRLLQLAAENVGTPTI